MANELRGLASLGTLRNELRGLASLGTLRKKKEKGSCKLISRNKNKVYMKMHAYNKGCGAGNQDLHVLQVSLLQSKFLYKSTFQV